MVGHERILAFIAKSNDPAQLQTIIENAKAQKENGVALAAFRRLALVSPPHQPGTIDHDIWQTIFAFEHLLKEERGRTTLLARTRQKLNRVGVIATLMDWATAKQATAGFKMLLERGLPDLTGEAIVLRHPKLFPRATIDAARARLSAEGVTDDAILNPLGDDFICADD